MSTAALLRAVRGVGGRLSSASSVPTTSFASEAVARSLAVGGTSGAHRFAAQAQPVDEDCVPLGHRNSRLDSASCNIGLNRRRDLALRTDFTLTDGSKGPVTLDQLLRGAGRRTVILGLPGGKVCDERHLPEYQAKAEALRKLGVGQIIVVLQKPDDVVAKWADSLGIGGGREKATSNCGIRAVADSSGSFTRLLGVEFIPRPEGAGEPCHHRYTALVEDGILLKLHVEESAAAFTPGTCGVAKMVDTINTLVADAAPKATKK